MECWNRYMAMSWQGAAKVQDADAGVSLRLTFALLCAKCRSLLDTQVSNQLNLLKAEVRRLRSKATAPALVQAV